MNGFRAGIICALAVPSVADVVTAADTCSDEACKASSSYAEGMLASMETDALSVNLLQRKASENSMASENLKAQDSQTSGSKCKLSCFSDKKSWAKKCKRNKCSGCFECNLQSGSYALYGDGECRGKKKGDDSWHAESGRYALNFNVYSVGGTSVGYSTFPRPWKNDDEKVRYRKPSSRLETQAFPEISNYCAQICNSLSFCKGYQLEMRGCENVKPGTAAASGDNCEYAYNGEAYCWSSASCYVVTDYKTYAKSPEAASAGMNMQWGVSKTFSTPMGDMTAQTYCSGGSSCDQDVQIGGKKTVQYPRSGYFCFMKNTNGAALLEEDTDEEDDADEDAEVNELESLSAGLVWPVSAEVTQLCANGTLLPVKSEVAEPFC